MFVYLLTHHNFSNLRMVFDEILVSTTCLRKKTGTIWNIKVFSLQVSETTEIHFTSISLNFQGLLAKLTQISVVQFYHTRENVWNKSIKVD